MVESGSIGPPWGISENPCPFIEPNNADDWFEILVWFEKVYPVEFPKSWHEIQFCWIIGSTVALKETESIQDGFIKVEGTLSLEQEKKEIAPPTTISSVTIWLFFFIGRN